ncbi:flavin-dependent oxidoreductase [Prauserella cavernicola]|uniref:Flavin-dependent oxidoreductase n=1 Tax=Prauserella cavernicola TaxID=2800127 RepID=A0A934V6T6_9PSEU|nr:flavin-dependent oxidoreductase [Prauserella cavernicola]MBK1787872.1 flavin-dependent oxidoreductase [Prauserella cavernicola]
MRVVIAGAGIGGLATALGLHAVGITDVLVAEAVGEIKPLGVGINVLPHAVRELTELGLADELAAIAVATGELAYFNRFGQRIWSEPRGVGAGYHWPQFSLHRGLLQELLLTAVRQRLGADAVRCGMPLTGFSDGPSGAVATFAGHAPVQCDLLVGADGIHSATRRVFEPQEGSPPWNGQVLWRGVSRGRPFLTGRSMIMAGDADEKFVAYPIAGPDADGTQPINWIAERPLGRDAVDRGKWNRPVDVAEILTHFGDWRFDWLDVAGVIRAAEVAYEYPMVDREPLSRWSGEHVTLLGDAAHAMYPIGSNGASQAILDARVLASALATSANVRSALARYEQERRPATTGIQLANRGMGPEVVMNLAAERAPQGFTDIDEVLPLAERREIAARYKQTAGFDPAVLNERPSYDVPPADRESSTADSPR